VCELRSLLPGVFNVREAETSCFAKSSKTVVPATLNYSEGLSPLP
jgi:hypothetical protein